MSASNSSQPDFWKSLDRLTPARIALGRAGGSLTSREQLRLLEAHAQARDAVHACLDAPQLNEQLQSLGLETVVLQTRAADRKTFLLRPDWGRKLSTASKDRLGTYPQGHDVGLVIGDGLSATAVHEHAPPLLKRVVPALNKLGFSLAPISLVQQARVAVSDEIGEILGCQLVVILIGERPGLSAPNSLGGYLTYHPRVGTTDEKRNCISNIRPAGLAYELAAQKLLYLIQESIRRKISGVQLKDDQDDSLTASGS